VCIYIAAAVERMGMVQDDGPGRARGRGLRCEGRAVRMCIARAEQRMGVTREGGLVRARGVGPRCAKHVRCTCKVTSERVAQAAQCDNRARPRR